MASTRAACAAAVTAERAQLQRQRDAEAQVRGGTVKRADPDEVARRALTRLLEEARGLHRDDRRGLVPRGKPDAIKWLALDLSDIAQAPPSETDYALAAGKQDARRGLILNLVFAALALAATALAARNFISAQNGLGDEATRAMSQLAEAAVNYEKVAYGYPNHAKAADAGVNSITACDFLIAAISRTVSSVNARPARRYQ